MGANTSSASVMRVSTANVASTWPDRYTPIKLNENAHSPVTPTSIAMPRAAPSQINESAIIELRARLTDIRQLSFTAKPGPYSRTGWAGRGEARVQVSDDDDGLRFHESGEFTPAATGVAVAFRNVYRWVLHADRISLWHERFGRDAAVWLFDLVPTTPREMVAAKSHRCGDDRYDARLRVVDEGFDLRWAIAGPRKDETLMYKYRP